MTLPTSPCRCSVLACLAYVNLGLGDPLPALSYARQLLRMPKLLGGLKFLGQVYAAEALVQLGSMTEALQHFNADSMADVNTSIPTAREHACVVPYKACGDLCYPCFRASAQ